MMNLHVILEHVEPIQESSEPLSSAGMPCGAGDEGEAAVVLVVAKGMVTLSGRIGFPAFDRSSRLVGFYRETANQLTFLPLSVAKAAGQVSADQALAAEAALHVEIDQVSKNGSVKTGP
jgi:hypothetical protein